MKKKSKKWNSISKEIDYIIRDFSNVHSFNDFSKEWMKYYKKIRSTSMKAVNKKNIDQLLQKEYKVVKRRVQSLEKDMEKKMKKALAKLDKVKKDVEKNLKNIEGITIIGIRKKKAKKKTKKKTTKKKTVSRKKTTKKTSSRKA